MQQYLEKFGKLPASTKLIVLVALVGVVFAVYYTTFFMPLQERISTLRADIEVLVGERDKAKSKADNLDKFKAEVARLREDLEKAKASLPNEREIPDLLKQVANLGKKIGLDFVLFRPQPDVNRDFYAEVPVEISVTGGYHEVAKFFAKVGQLKRIVNIQNVVLASPSEKNGKMVLTVTGQVVTFRFLEGAVAAGGAK